MEILHLKDLGDTESVITNAVLVRICQIQSLTFVLCSFRYFIFVSNFKAKSNNYLWRYCILLKIWGYRVSLGCLGNTECHQAVWGIQSVIRLFGEYRVSLGCLGHTECHQAAIQKACIPYIYSIHNACNHKFIAFTMHVYHIFIAFTYHACPTNKAFIRHVYHTFISFHSTCTSSIYDAIVILIYLFISSHGNFGMCLTLVSMVRTWIVLYIYIYIISHNNYMTKLSINYVGDQNNPRYMVSKSVQ